MRTLELKALTLKFRKTKVLIYSKVGGFAKSIDFERVLYNTIWFDLSILCWRWRSKLSVSFGSYEEVLVVYVRWQVGVELSEWSERFLLWSSASFNQLVSFPRKVNSSSSFRIQTFLFFLFIPWFLCALNILDKSLLFWPIRSDWREYCYIIDFVKVGFGSYILGDY